MPLRYLVQFSLAVIALPIASMDYESHHESYQFLVVKHALHRFVFVDKILNHNNVSRTNDAHQTISNRICHAPNKSFRDDLHALSIELHLHLAEKINLFLPHGRLLQTTIHKYPLLMLNGKIRLTDDATSAFA